MSPCSHSSEADGLVCTLKAACPSSAPHHLTHPPLVFHMQYPYFSTAALSRSNPFFTGDELNGCGQCFQIMCGDKRAGEE